MSRKEVVVRDCDRCGGRKKPATATRRFGVDKDQYELDLCEEHVGAFDRDLGAWARLARDVTPAVYKAQFDVTRERHIDLAAKGHFSAAPEPSPDPRVVTVHKLPAQYHLWELSSHAIRRCQERGISQRDAMLAASDPAVAFPDVDPGHDEYWIHQRGEVTVVVVRKRKVVVTVMSREEFRSKHGLKYDNNQREAASAN